MKFALSTLSTAVMTVTLMSVAASNSASANDDNMLSQHQLTPVVVTQIVDADNQSSPQTQKSKVQNKASSPEVEMSQVEPNARLTTLIDPITHKSIDNSYPLEVASLLSLEQAQNILLQVSPKIAANQAAIAASEYQTDALKTIDNPLVFARVSANAYNLDADIDLSTLKNGIVNDINNNAHETNLKNNFSGILVTTL